MAYNEDITIKKNNMNWETQILFDEMIEGQVNKEIEERGEVAEWQRSVDEGDVSAKDYL